MCKWKGRKKIIRRRKNPCRIAEGMYLEIEVLYLGRGGTNSTVTRGVVGELCLRGEC